MLEEYEIKFEKDRGRCPVVTLFCVYLLWSALISLLVASSRRLLVNVWIILSLFPSPLSSLVFILRNSFPLGWKDTRSGSYCYFQQPSSWEYRDFVHHLSLPPVPQYNLLGKEEDALWILCIESLKFQLYSNCLVFMV